MKKSDEWYRFPVLRLLIEQISLDNDMPMKESPTWPTNAFELEELAKRLKLMGVSVKVENPFYKNEVELLAMGERSDAEKLIEAKSLQTLDKFLNQAFDGDLTEDFYL